jgi:hypothetical protein
MRVRMSYADALEFVTLAAGVGIFPELDRGFT